MRISSSIRLQLFVWVLAPLTAFFALSAWLARADTRRLAQLVQDNALLASARTIAEQIREADGTVEAVIPPSAIERLATPFRDRVVYRVIGPAGDLLAGYPDVPDPPSPQRSLDPQWFNGSFRGQPIRAAALGQIVAGRENKLAVVVVGETMLASEAMADDLWRGVLEREAAAVALTGLLIFFGLRHGLAPLIRLRDAVVARDPGSLNRLDPGLVQNELKPVVRALNEAIDGIERQIVLKDRLLNDAAHQLRTPLAVLRTQAAVGMRSRTTADKDEALEAMAATASDMTRLTNQMLTLARIEAVAENATREVVDLREIVRRVLANQAVRALDQGIELDFEEPAAPAPVLGNPTLLSELVANLVDNALRHGHAGKLVALRLFQSSDTVQLEVRDHGPGIPPAELGRVFERFYRPAGMETEGSGLGLAIVKEIATLHHGAVSLRQPDEGAGLIVQLALPAHASA